MQNTVTIAYINLNPYPAGIKSDQPLLSVLCQVSLQIRSDNTVRPSFHLDIPKNDNRQFQNCKVDNSIYAIQQVKS